MRIHLPALMQDDMDDEKPECVLDGLIKHQRQEIQIYGEPKSLTDDVLKSLLSFTFLGGKEVHGFLYFFHTKV